jgi:hypothetical protein
MFERDGDELFKPFIPSTTKVINGNASGQHAGEQGHLIFFFLFFYRFLEGRCRALRMTYY